MYKFNFNNRNGKFNNNLLKDVGFIEKGIQGIKDVIIEYECDSDEDVQNPDNSFPTDDQLL